MAKELPAPGAHRSPAPGWRPWVYLASGMGFAAQERALVLPRVVAALEAAGVRVFEPFTDNAEGAKTGGAGAGLGVPHRPGRHRCGAALRWHLLRLQRQPP